MTSSEELDIFVYKEGEIDSLPDTLQDSLNNRPGPEVNREKCILLNGLHFHMAVVFSKFKSDYSTIRTGDFRSTYLRTHMTSSVFGETRVGTT